MSEAQAEEHVEEHVDEVAVEAPDYSDSPFIETAIEMGYVNPADFAGTPPKNGFKTPEEFIKDTWKIVKGKSEKEQQMARELASVKQTVEQMAANHTKELIAQKAKIIADLEAERAEAVEEGDKERFNRLERQLEQEKRGLDVPAQPAANQLPPGFAEEGERFKQKFGAQIDQQADNELRMFAQTLAPGLSAEAFYGQLEARLKKLFPERFAADIAPPTAGGEKGKPSSGSAWNKLVREEPEVKRYFSELVEMGVYADTKEAREKYAKQVNEA